MDPFTTILRAVIGKKMVEGAKQAYNETRSSVDKFFSDWDSALRADYQRKNANGNGNKNTAKANADAVANLFEKNGTINTDPLANSRKGSATNQNGNSTGATRTVETTETTETTGNVTAPSEPVSAKPVEDETDVITYTYKPGDTFGQVLLNLGLSDGSHLWGQGGDVEYYTQQLVDQGMLDSRGNVKLGIPFKLRRRR